MERHNLRSVVHVAVILRLTSTADPPAMRGIARQHKYADGWRV